MKISLNWLKEYVKCDLDTSEIAKILTDTGLEVEKVESVEAVKGGLKGVVVGEITEMWQHPNADRLRLTKVNIGQEAELQIVCGASNIEKGQKVLVSTIGTMLYPSGSEPFKIKKGKIRGEVSEGMICAEEELGLGSGHDGIMVLDSSATPGASAASYLDLEGDTSIEIGLTPNRTDAMGHIGVARDLVVAVKHMKGIQNDPSLPLSPPQFDVLSQSKSTVSVDISDSSLCYRYTGISISNVSVADSPEWLVKRLKAIGVEPINNVVDITNYVMHEFGHPLHAFDANHIANNQIKVQSLPSGTKFKTLDGTERELSDKDLMICDGNQTPLCIAGVLGGVDSGISDKTQTIFLECAVFNPVSVRKTARRHQLNTDASFRFERGIDADQCADVLSRATSLIREIAGGEIEGGMVDVYPNQQDKVEVAFSLERCNALIGTQIPAEKVKAILEDLDFEVIPKNESEWMVKCPKYRVDVTREADVIEEILRIYGYNSIPMPEKLNSSLNHGTGSKEEQTRNKVADLLSSIGFNEMMSNSLTKSGHSEISSAESFGVPVKLLNPLSQDLAELRTTLTYNMLQACEYNLNRKSNRLKFYEFGNVYAKRDKGYDETLMLGLMITGAQQQDSWNSNKEPSSLFDVISSIGLVLDRLGIEWQAKQDENGVKLLQRKKTLATVRKASAKELSHFGISQEVNLGFINWSEVYSLSMNQTIKYQTPSKYPSVKRDLSLLLDDQVSFNELKTAIKQAGGNLIKDVNLFDVYEGKNLPTGKKSYALSIFLSDMEKTLTDKVIDKTMKKIIGSLQHTLKAELR